MTNLTKAFLMLVCVLAFSSSVYGQPQWLPADGKVFVSVNTGNQGHSRGISASDTFSLYGEVATLRASQEMFEGGRIFDMSGGYRVWTMQKGAFGRSPGHVGVAIGFATFGDTKSGSVEGSIPHPLFFNRARPVSSSASGLEHSQRSVYFQAVYFQPIIEDKLEASVGIGPTFFSVSQDFMAPFTSGFRGLVPSGTQDLSVGSPTSEDASATSLIFQIDVNYLFTKNLGAGIFLRRNGATVDLPSLDNVDVGGFQGGVGVRLRF